jgi:hypothetical protein
MNGVYEQDPKQRDGQSKMIGKGETTFETATADRCLIGDKDSSKASAKPKFGTGDVGCLSYHRKSNTSIR